MNGAIYGRTVPVPKQRRRRLVMSFEMVRLDRASSEPLYQQLCRQIREELESGSFDSSASRVPSSRVLAATLRISRPTVNQAFSKLVEEGYLQVRKRSGIFVADHLPATFLKAARLATGARTEHSPRVAQRVTRMTDSRSGRQLDVGIGGPPSVTLIAGLPAVDEFPIAVWERLREQVLAKREPTYYVMPRAVAKSNCERQSLLTSATFAAPIVMPTKSSSWVACSKRCWRARSR